jgi:hypothetical protein
MDRSIIFTGFIETSRKLGARFPAQTNKDANLVERRKVAPFGIYTLVCFERTVPSAA